MKEKLPIYSDFCMMNSEVATSLLRTGIVTGEFWQDVLNPHNSTNLLNSLDKHFCNQLELRPF